MSYAQQRLWFLDQLVPGNPFYNIDYSIRLHGGLDISVLERSLNEIVRRHAILRTTFATDAGEPVQVVASSLSLALPVIDLRHLPPAEREAEAARLATGEARTLRLGPRPAAARQPAAWAMLSRSSCSAVHHIVSDGWSMGTFPRVDRPVRRLPGRAALPPGRVAHSVRRFRRLAAQLPAGRGAGEATDLLANVLRPTCPCCNSYRPPQADGADLSRGASLVLLDVPGQKRHEHSASRR